MGVKRAWAVLLGLALVVILAGCGIKTSINEDKEQDKPGEFVYGPEVQIAELLAAERPSFDELRRAFFELGAAARWDFMPEFGYEGAAAPEEMSEYIYLIVAQSLVWDGYWNIDHERTPEQLSTEYVDEFMQVHFGFTVAHPELSEFGNNPAYKGIDFNGENYGSHTSWAYMPLYRLEGLSSVNEDVNGQSRVVYEALLWEYSYWPYDLPEGSSELEDVLADTEELFCKDIEPTLPEGMTKEREQHVRFYLDEQNQIRYLGARSIGDL